MNTNTLEQAGIADEPLLRSINRHGKVQARGLSGIDIARVVKKLALRAGLEAAKYAGHSLRAGHAAIAAASERSIMNQTGIGRFSWWGATFVRGAYFERIAREKLGLVGRLH